jgi:coenzyme F420-reducing hydrogenase beta subunit
MLKVEKSSPDLEAEVIYSGKCAHCGTCGAFCHHITYDDVGLPEFEFECQETIGLCYNSCPRTDLPLGNIDEKLFGQKRVDMALGVYKDIISIKPKKAESVLLGLIETAFSKKIIDSMVLPKDATKTKGKNNNIPVVVKSAKKAKELIPERSMQLAGPLVTGVGEAWEDGGCNIGFLGNPCHITGLSKVILSPFSTGANNTSLKIGFMCASGGLPGCKFCVDFTAEHSDLSIGTMGAEKEETLVIIRNKIGGDLVDAAIKDGLIEIANKTPDLIKLKELTNRKKRKNIQTLLGTDMAKIHYLGLTFEDLKYFMGK